MKKKKLALGCLSEAQRPGTYIAARPRPSAMSGGVEVHCAARSSVFPRGRVTQGRKRSPRSRLPVRAEMGIYRNRPLSQGVAVHPSSLGAWPERTDIWGVTGRGSRGSGRPPCPDSGSRWRPPCWDRRPQ